LTNPYPGDSEWPSDFQGCEIKGHFVGLTGAPIVGSVTFTAQTDVLISSTTSTVVVPQSITVQLDIHGKLDIVVPATDDPDIIPTDFTYLVKENWAGGRTYSITAPHDGIEDLSQVAPVPASPGVVNYLVTPAQYAELLSGIGGYATQAWVDSEIAAAIAACSPPIFTDTSAPDGTVAIPYSYRIHASAYPVATYAITSGTLPAGLSFNNVTGDITGTPTAGASVSLVVKATNNFGSELAEVNFTVASSASAPVFAMHSPPSGVVDSIYSYSFSASGSPTPVYTITAGNLPPGLWLDPSGVLEGIPATVGSYTFTVTATNTSGTDTASCTVVVTAAAVTTTLFGSRTPATPASDSPITVGMAFTVDKTCTSTRARYWRQGTQNDTRTIFVGLYDGSGTLIASGSRLQTSADAIGWIWVDFSATVTMNTGQTYTIAYFDPTGAYSFTTGEAATAIDNSPSHTVATGGRFTTGSSLTRPTSTSTASFYVGLEFHSAGQGFFDNPSAFTGVPAGTTLTASAGFHTSADNQVIDSLDVTGSIYVDHTGVIIRKCRILAGVGEWGIDIGFSGPASVTITDCEINCNSSSAGGIRSQYRSGTVSWTAARCNIHHGENAVRLGGNCTISDSWMHTFTSSGGSPHYDGVECSEGSNSTVSHCYIDLDQTQTCAINVQGDFGPITNFICKDSYLNGGGPLFNIRTGGAGGTVNSFKLLGNSLGVPGAHYGDGSLQYSAIDVGITRQVLNNTVFTTGANADSLI